MSADQKPADVGKTVEAVHTTLKDSVEIAGDLHGLMSESQENLAKARELLARSKLLTEQIEALNILRGGGSL